jgi:hypothetical protein
MFGLLSTFVSLQMTELTLDQLGHELIVIHQEVNQAVIFAKELRERAEDWVALNPASVESIKNYREAEEKVDGLKREEASLIKQIIAMTDPELVWGASHLNKPIFLRYTGEDAASFYVLEVDKTYLSLFPDNPKFKLNLIENQ